MAVRGKVFEGELKRSMENAGVYVERIPDKVFWNGHRMAGEQTPADFVMFAPVGDRVHGLMVEAKAVGGKSIPFDRLQPHQAAALDAFGSHHRDMHGYVAVNYYDKANVKRFNELYMVPFEVWRGYEEAGERKSLALSQCEDDPRIVMCPRAKGSVYDMSPFVESLGGTFDVDI